MKSVLFGAIPLAFSLLSLGSSVAQAQPVPRAIVHPTCKPEVRSASGLLPSDR